MLFLRLPLIVLSISLLTGCVRHVPLDKSQAEQIKSTKLVVVKQQDTLEFHGIHILPVIYVLDPMVSVVGTAVLTGVNVFIWEPREQAVFAPIKKDLESYSFENELAQSFINAAHTNQYFKFSSTEVVTIGDQKDLVKILQNSDADHVALLTPTYTINNNIFYINVKIQISIYNKLVKWKNKNKLPEPIYQTAVRYSYSLPKASWFSHGKNASRMQKNGSKLVIDTLNTSVLKLTKNLTTKLEEPYA